MWFIDLTIRCFLYIYEIWALIFIQNEFQRINKLILVVYTCFVIHLYVEINRIRSYEINYLIEHYKRTMKKQTNKFKEEE